MNTVTITNQTISLDEQGRISLNTLHKVSQTGEAKKPSNWLRLDSAKEMIEELTRCSDMSIAPISVAKGGINQGTHAHELLAISYAGWISPRFQLQVNQAFLDSRKPQAQPLLKDGETTISKDRYIELLEMENQALKRQPKRKARLPNTPLTTDEKQRIITLHRQGYNKKEIAGHLNRSFSAVRAVIRENQ